MAPFALSAVVDPDDVAWRLMSVSFVTMFYNSQVLDQTANWLREHEYSLHTVDAASWKNDKAAYHDLGVAFDFPDYYNPSLSGLSDCWGDVACYDYGADPTQAGTVLLLADAGPFIRTHTMAAHAILDTFADGARVGALVGHRMLCLVAVDDPSLQLPGVGNTNVAWNPQEFNAAARMVAQMA